MTFQQWLLHLSCRCHVHKRNLVTTQSIAASIAFILCITTFVTETKLISSIKINYEKNFILISTPTSFASCYVSKAASYFHICIYLFGRFESLYLFFHTYPNYEIPQAETSQCLTAKKKRE
jgi:hypothetical protein